MLYSENPMHADVAEDAAQSSGSSEAFMSHDLYGLMWGDGEEPDRREEESGDPDNAFLFTDNPLYRTETPQAAPAPAATRARSMWRTVLQKSKPKPAKEPEPAPAQTRARSLWRTIMQRPPTQAAMDASAAATAAAAGGSGSVGSGNGGGGSEAMREYDAGDAVDGSANPLFDAILNSHKRGGRRSVSKTLYDMVTRNAKLARSNTVRRPALARRNNR